MSHQRRRYLAVGALVVGALGVAAACWLGSSRETGAALMDVPFKKSDQEWRQALTPEQYRVTRQKGTERAFTGAYWNVKDPGTYQCVCCGQPLFSSETKFESGTGWPSFWEPVEKEKV